MDWTRRPKTALALRARIVQLSAAGHSKTEVARRVPVALATVGKWRLRFVLLRLDGLLDKPRPGTPRRLSDAAVERVLARTLATQPQAATHWSTRSLAQATALSQSSISRIWRAFSLQPHRSQAFKLSRDPLLIDKVRDIGEFFSHWMGLAFGGRGSQFEQGARHARLLRSKPTFR